jgi:hypothetical protein
VSVSIRNAGALERGDGAEQLARGDGHVERQCIDQSAAGRSVVDAIEDVGLEPGEQARSASSSFARVVPDQAGIGCLGLLSARCGNVSPKVSSVPPASIQAPLTASANVNLLRMSGHL